MTKYSTIKNLEKKFGVSISRDFYDDQDVEVYDVFCECEYGSKSAHLHIEEISGYHALRHFLYHTLPTRKKVGVSLPLFYKITRTL